MPIKYKIEIMKALKDAGYSTYRLRKEKILGEATLQKFRKNQLVSWENTATICKLLNCQPGVYWNTYQMKPMTSLMIKTPGTYSHCVSFIP